jgi:hypothetical protein
MRIEQLNRPQKNLEGAFSKSFENIAFLSSSAGFGPFPKSLKSRLWVHMMLVRKVMMIFSREVRTTASFFLILSVG